MKTVRNITKMHLVNINMQKETQEICKILILQ